MSETGNSLLTRYVESLRRSAREDAEQLRILAEFAALDPGGEFTHLEVAAVSRTSEHFAHSRLELAEAPATRLPRTWAALRAGVIDGYKARRVMLATGTLSDELAGRVEQDLIPNAAEWNTRQLNDRLRRAVIRADPEAANARAAAKTAARRMTHENLGDGAGLLLIQGDVERTRLACGRVWTIAKALESAGDDRTLDQITADLALDCLAGKGLENAKVHVWLTLPATTALGVDEKPAHLAGCGWLPAQRALTLAGQEDATWRRILVDPATGQALDVGRRRYRPPAALRDHGNATHPTRVPGRAVPARPTTANRIIGSRFLPDRPTRRTCIRQVRVTITRRPMVAGVSPKPATA